jgi:hypothetical protein
VQYSICRSKKIQIRHIPFPALVYEKQHDFEDQNPVNRTPVKSNSKEKRKFEDAKLILSEKFSDEINGRRIY